MESLSLSPDVCDNCESPEDRSKTVTWNPLFISHVRDDCFLLSRITFVSIFVMYNSLSYGILSPLQTTQTLTNVIPQSRIDLEPGAGVGNYLVPEPPDFLRVLYT